MTTTLGATTTRTIATTYGHPGFGLRPHTLEWLLCFSGLVFLVEPRTRSFQWPEPQLKSSVPKKISQRKRNLELGFYIPLSRQSGKRPLQCGAKKIVWLVGLRESFRTYLVVSIHPIRFLLTGSASWGSCRSECINTYSYLSLASFKSREKWPQNEMSKAHCARPQM